MVSCKENNLEKLSRISYIRNNIRVYLKININLVIIHILDSHACDELLETMHEEYIR